ncbi:hypothetical protein FRB99_001303 [Tulasnella sp. 403]|nr:hypothetical protein FRB99_001303 [Tulasnella sp. 403]
MPFAVTERHWRLVISILTSVCAAVQLALLAIGKIDPHFPARYRSTYIYLITLSALVVSFSAIVGLLNFVLRRWLRYQLLFEVVWIVFMFSFQVSGLVVSILVQFWLGSRRGTPGFYAMYHRNIALVTMSCLTILFNIVQAVLLVRVIIKIRSISHFPISTILFTDTRDLPSLPTLPTTLQHTPQFTTSRFISPRRHRHDSRNSSMAREALLPTRHAHDRSASIAQLASQPSPPLPAASPPILTSLHHERHARASSYGQDSFRGALQLPLLTTP